MVTGTAVNQLDEAREEIAGEFEQMTARDTAIWFKKWTPKVGLRPLGRILISLIK